MRLIFLSKYFSALFCLFYVSFSAYAVNDLPNIGSSSSRALSIVKEQAIGDDYMRQIRAMAPIVNDAEINDYIQHLGFKLVENNPATQDRQFSFFILHDNSLNAFALPGGYIGFHTGLIIKTENESELASVVAHEIAHVTQRHLARRLEQQNQLALPSLAAFLAAIIIASQADNSETAMGALMGAQGLAQQVMINHTRANEAEADRVGISTMYSSGFDPKGAISFFEKMQQNQRYYSNAFEFLRTHPLSRSRITDARLRANQYPKRIFKDSLIYALMKEKIKALSAKINPKTINEQTILYNKGQIKTPAQLYGHAIFMIRAKNFALAEKTLRNLQFSDAKRPSYAIALAQLDIERKTPHKSIAVIQSLLIQSPGNQALVETLAALLLANKNYEQARELLLSNIHMTSYAPYLLKQLADAQENSGHDSEAYETEGNYLLAMGDLNGARGLFEQALNIHTKDPYARTRINSQINQIKEFLYQRSLRH